MAKTAAQVFMLLASSQATVAQAKSALLLIDVQDCFLEANTTSGSPGTLSVPASHIIPVINKIREEKDCLFDLVVYTQDFHPANHVSFASTHGVAPYAHLDPTGGLPITCVSPASGNTADAACCPTQYLNASAVDCATQLCPAGNWTWADANPGFVESNPACEICASDPSKCFQDTQAMWPDHCLQDGDSTMPPSLTIKETDVVIQKGLHQHVDAYSAFMDNSKNLKTALDAKLQEHEIDTLYVGGIATDICVRWTVEDALGDLTGDYTVKVISDAAAGLSLGSTPTELHELALVAMEEEGAAIITSADLLGMQCPGDDGEAQTPSNESEKETDAANQQAACAVTASAAVASAALFATL